MKLIENKRFRRNKHFWGCYTVDGSRNCQIVDKECVAEALPYFPTPVSSVLVYIDQSGWEIKTLNNLTIAHFSYKVPFLFKLQTPVYDSFSKDPIAEEVNILLVLSSWNYLCLPIFIYGVYLELLWEMRLSGWMTQGHCGQQFILRLCSLQPHIWPFSFLALFLKTVLACLQYSHFCAFLLSRIIFCFFYVKRVGCKIRMVELYFIVPVQLGSLIRQIFKNWFLHILCDVHFLLILYLTNDFISTYHFTSTLYLDMLLCKLLHVCNFSHMVRTENLSLRLLQQMPVNQIVDAIGVT